LHLDCGRWTDLMAILGHWIIILRNNNDLCHGGLRLIAIGDSVDSAPLAVFDNGVYGAPLGIMLALCCLDHGRRQPGCPCATLPYAFPKGIKTAAVYWRHTTSSNFVVINSPDCQNDYNKTTSRDYWPSYY
jgi:hypothetical protein